LVSIHIIGGGLAGSEAAWQVARAGWHVILHEMRPVRRTPAHGTDRPSWFAATR
jgi:methylenetetrahydrofolate--tRNA-(uracil-5-)-methyltransferase